MGSELHLGLINGTRVDPAQVSYTGVVPHRGILHVPLLSLCVVLLLAVGDAWPADDIRIEAQLDRGTVALDETATLVVKAEWEGPSDRFALVIPQAPRVHNLIVIGSKRGTRSWADEKGEHSAQEFSYVLQPESEGNAAVGAIRVQFTTPEGASGDLVTQPLQLRVGSPVHTRWCFSWGDVGGLVVLAGLAGYAGWRRWKKKTVRETASLRGQKDPFAAALSEIASARKAGNRKAFYGAVLSLLRQLTSERTGVPTAALGARDLVPFADRLVSDESSAEQLRDLLSRIDAILYAPATDDLDAGMDVTELFVRNLVSENQIGKRERKDAS